MKHLLLLVLTMCTLTTHAQKELFNFKSTQFSEFNLNTELISDIIVDKTISLVYVEEEHDSFIHMTFGENVITSKVISINENIAGLYEDYLWIESYYEIDEVYIHLLLPKIITNYFILIFANSNKKVAIQCQI